MLIKVDATPINPDTYDLSNSPSIATPIDVPLPQMFSRSIATLNSGLRVVATRGGDRVSVRMQSDSLVVRRQVARWSDLSVASASSVVGPHRRHASGRRLRQW